MNKAEFGGGDLQNRKKAKLMTGMAVVILSIFIPGCPTDGNPGGPLPGNDPTVTSVTITGDGVVTKDVSLEVTKQYSATVAGTNSPSQTVTWSIDGGAPTGVTLAGGLLTVQKTASNGDITIRATSTVLNYTH
ncbi:MAG: hypothetical protein LBG22_02995, partial [Treponema sp.]|nr:hypothetical protein [Treponema sp.]